VYWADHGVASVGLRPHTVFGPGRDQGLTSAPTTAMLAAAAGLEYRIPFGGTSQFQYAPDAARAFVAAARASAEGADVHNLAGTSVSMAEVVAAITAAAPDSAGRIEYDEVLLPFPGVVDASSFAALVGAVPETPFPEAVADSVGRFRDLIARGLVDPARVLR
jgi:nucleoside-diphosphate-sugar epimerase